MPQSATAQDTNKATEESSPILISLGKKKRKNIKKLRKGRGPLMETIEETMAELKSHNKIQADAQPVVIVVREKRRRRLRGWGW